jgi:hypothetical protein
VNIFLAAFLACVLSHLVVLAALRGWAIWKLRSVVRQYGAQGNDRIADLPNIEALIAQTNAARPAAKPPADCQHPEEWHYVVAISNNPRNPGTIFWCRSCGSLKGWKPADDASGSEWQGPAYESNVHPVSTSISDNTLDKDRREDG